MFYCVHVTEVSAVARSGMSANGGIHVSKKMPDARQAAGKRCLLFLPAACAKGVGIHCYGV
jgi:hypothetical protein